MESGLFYININQQVKGLQMKLYSKNIKCTLKNRKSMRFDGTCIIMAFSIEEFQ